MICCFLLEGVSSQYDLIYRDIYFWRDSRISGYVILEYPEDGGVSRCQAVRCDRGNVNIFTHIANCKMCLYVHEMFLRVRLHSPFLRTRQNSKGAGIHSFRGITFTEHVHTLRGEYSRRFSSVGGQTLGLCYQRICFPITCVISMRRSYID
jgi:hypothetical protein